MKKKCELCNDTGIVEFVDFSKLNHLENKSYDFNELLKEYGEKEFCECQLIILN